MYSVNGINFQIGLHNHPCYSIRSQFNHDVGSSHAHFPSYVSTPINIWSPAAFNCYAGNALMNYSNLIRLREQILRVPVVTSPKATSPNTLPPSRLPPQRRPLFDPECKDNDGCISVAKNWRAPKVSGGRAEHRRRLKRYAAKRSLKVNSSTQVNHASPREAAGGTVVFTDILHGYKLNSAIQPIDLSPASPVIVAESVAPLYRSPLIQTAPPLHITLDSVDLQDVDVHQCGLNLSEFAYQNAVGQKKLRSRIILRGDSVFSFKNVVNTPLSCCECPCSHCGLNWRPSCGYFGIVDTHHNVCHYQKHSPVNLSAVCRTPIGCCLCTFGFPTYRALRDSSKLLDAALNHQFEHPATSDYLSLRHPNLVWRPCENGITTFEHRSLKRCRTSITHSDSTIKCHSPRFNSSSNLFTRVQKKRCCKKIGYTTKVKTSWRCGHVQFLDESCVQFIVESNDSSSTLC